MKEGTSTWNSWIECLVSWDIENQIRKHCSDHKITIHKIESVAVKQDLIGRLIGRRNTVYFNLEGKTSEIKALREKLLSLVLESRI